MKCANETVTIELKNGMPNHRERLLCYFADRQRHNPPRHHNLRVAPNEHRPPRRQDDPQGSRADISGYDQHPRLDDTVLHSPGLLASGHATHQ